MERLTANLNPKRILVRCPNWIGDAVMATPFLTSLRQRYPDASITYLARAYVKEVYDGAPSYDDFIITDNKKSYGFFRRFLRINKNASMLKSGNFDLAVLLCNSFESALMVKLAGIPHRVGYKRNFRRLLLSDGPCPERKYGLFVPVPMIKYYNKIGECLGFKNYTESMRLYITEKEREKAKAVCEKYGISPLDNLIGLNLGAAFGGSKLWVPEYFAKVGDYFAADPKNKVLLFSGPKEEVILDRISKTMKNPYIKFNSSEVPIGVLKVMIEKLSLFITNDTGPRHFASSLGVPSVVLIGATHPKWTENSDKNQVVLGKIPVCGPCHLRRCPLNHQCMKNIKPSDVIAVAESLLETVKI